jgi:hypothetical protein
MIGIIDAAAAAVMLMMVIAMIGLFDYIMNLSRLCIVGDGGDGDK